MDRNYIVGMGLLFVLFIVWYQINAPNAEELEQNRMRQDSLNMVQLAIQDSINKSQIKEEIPSLENEIVNTGNDSLITRYQQDKFGPFVAAATGDQVEVVLENDVLKLTLDSKGGKIKEAWLKEYFVMKQDSQKKDYKVDLKLLDNEKNSFSYILPLANSKEIRTNDLYFDVDQKNNKHVVFRLKASNGGVFEQHYKLSQDSYTLDYEVKFKRLDQVVRPNDQRIVLDWTNYLNKLEKNSSFEQSYSTVYFKDAEEDTDYCNCRSDATEDLTARPIKWVSHANQFFSTNLIAKEKFRGGVFSTEGIEDPKILKKLGSQLGLPVNDLSNESVAMTMYVGPNQFDMLEELGHDMTDIIPFGWSIFGTINRWVIRPIFNFLSSFIGSVGIVILVLTVIVKLLVFPLTYKMIHSQSKMSVLKPVMAGMKEKFKDDQQKQQMETMKVYREYGVNPLGGCFPMVLQMPIWFALYRFFPAAIEFRQTSFLWANDLSTYDSFLQLPFEIPMMGSHLSLFTLLWVITLIIYTYYNSKYNMDMSAANPMMKNMQYIMPVMFFVFLNQYASGLTCYLLFSNILNITQTIGTKKYLIDDEKIKAQLTKNKEQPKQKSKFQQRLDKAMKEQRRISDQKQQAGKKKK
jgi:YidC/Oxa1 family membrane protein insertase